jgi:hypothetical protein
VILFASGLLWAALVLVLTEIIRYASHRNEPEFGVLAVALVAYLDAISFMSGFSIGWALSILNVALGLTLTALTTHYRRQILFVTLVGLLLALSLRGHFFWFAFPTLQTLLAMTVMGAALQVARGWWHQDKRTLSSAGIALVACLAGLTLLILPHSSPLATGLFFCTTAMSALLGILATQYRLSFFIVGTFSLLWAIALLVE